MSKILIIGGTGFAGGFIAKEAEKRHHEVTVLSRSQPQTSIEGIEYIQGSALDAELVADLIAKSDIVIGAVSPRGDMAGKIAPLYTELAHRVAEHGARFIVIGGFSSLRPAEGAPRFFEDGSIPPEYKDEALELASVFEALKNDAPESLDWLFVSPAAAFGAYVEVPDTGSYRISGDVALFDEKGESKISGADFAIGVVDEIEKSQYHKENISLVQ